jgi:hypothetical protein
MLRYLSQLAKRMVAVGFTQTDELLRETWAARNAVLGLRVRLHYLDVDVRKRVSDATKYGAK